MTADEVIRRLALMPHPEGGHYREIFRAASPAGGRGAMTSIYYLLRPGERSHWHRVDAVEIWHHHAGGALELAISPDGMSVETHVLGSGLLDGHRPQAVVPAGHWQAARPLGAGVRDWVLVGCAVAPAFEFSGFEMAPVDWEPGKD